MLNNKMEILFSTFPRQSPAQFSQIEQDALKLAQEMTAEFWAVSSLTGEDSTLYNCNCCQFISVKFI